MLNTFTVVPGSFPVFPKVAVTFPWLHKIPAASEMDSKPMQVLHVPILCLCPFLQDQPPNLQRSHVQPLARCELSHRLTRFQVMHPPPGHLAAAGTKRNCWIFGRSASLCKIMRGSRAKTSALMLASVVLCTLAGSGCVLEGQGLRKLCTHGHL